MNDGALFSQISPPAVERSLKYPPPVRQPSESDKETTGPREEKKKDHTNRSKSPERHQREERASEISPPAAERSLKYPPPVRPVVSRTHQPYRSDKGRLDPEEKRRKIIPTVVGGPERGQQEASRSAQWRSAASWISFSSISRKITTLP